MVFGQEFPAAFQERNGEKERAPGTKACRYCGMILAIKGGMRFAFPPDSDWLRPGTTMSGPSTSTPAWGKKLS